MKTLLSSCLLLAVVPGARADVRREGEAWLLEDTQLKVTVGAENAHLTVLDKTSGMLWRQEDPARHAANQDDVRVRCTAKPIVVDGNPEEWSQIPHGDYIWLPWMGDNGEANCSGGAKIMWDDKMLYLYVRIRDDNVAFGGEATELWWESDSVEFWVDSVQVGLHLAPTGKEAAVDSRGKVFAASKVALQLVTTDHLPGYELEMAIPLEHFPVLKDAKAGIRFSFALGLNDADPRPGAAVRRDRQSYSPRGWVHSAPMTFSVAVLTDEQGQTPARSIENDRSAQAAGRRISEMKPGARPNSLTYKYILQEGQTAEIPFQVTMELVDGKAALDVELECRSGPETPIKPFSYPFALYPSKPETYFVAVADYTNGRYLPVGDPFCRSKEFCLAGGDLPFLLVTDGQQGLSATLLTPWDASVQMQTRSDEPDNFGFPGFRWYPTKGVWARARKGRLSFFANGGYVTACKIYREMAQEQGLVRTFTEKAKQKPNVRKLFGAVNWWGGSPDFALEAKAAGMTHGLLNGRPSPESMAEVVAQGWLMSEYDNYEDINDSEVIDRAKAPVKTHSVVKADGEFMTAWVTRDKDMNPVHTYMKQCTGVMTKCARIVIPKVLATYPYNTRFLDVTTATGLKECYSPLHPCDRKQDQANRESLCAYVGDELGLVAGGEHGKYYDVRFLDYHEGMMGGGCYSWPAGYLRDIKSREEIDERYLKYGIDPTYRVPMFELVFHDCVVDYWYWGATNDYLHKFAPEITDRKTAMNVLYGTPPMMWVNSHGLRWSEPEERQLMIQIYQQTCKLHEVIADQEMVSHEFLTPDRKVQRSTFSDGTVCTVNFGDPAYKVAAGEREFCLGANDFYVKGPKVEQWRRRTGGADDERDVYIRTEQCLLVQKPAGTVRQPGLVASGNVSLQRDEAGARISLGNGAILDLDLAAYCSDWRGKAAALLALDERGNVRCRGPVVRDGKLSLKAGDQDARYALLVGDAANAPDLVVSRLDVKLDRRPDGGDRASPVAILIDAEVKNLGLATAQEAVFTIQLDGRSGTVLLEKRIPALAAGGELSFHTSLPGDRADGQRRIISSISGTELTQTGPARKTVPFRTPTVASAFPIRQVLGFHVPGGDAEGLAIEMPYQLPAEADPANLRVLFASGISTPAQFESGKEAPGNLVFVLPAGVPAGHAQAELLAVPEGAEGGVYPPASPFIAPEDGSRMVFGAYSLTLHQGTLTDIAVHQPDGSELTVVSSIIESSQETGWSSEPGELTDFALEEIGPVRAVFRISKTLEGGYKLTRRFRFYEDRFEVISACQPHRSLLTRTMYAVDGIVVKGSGGQAVMDGVGENEDFGFKGQPQWFAAFGPKYRSACFALTQAEGFTYWDSGTHRGQIGLGCPGTTERRVFLWGPGTDNADFAKEAWKAYAETLKK
ncbi:MAG: glycoside hydrolase [Thermoguttaceae bacterium]|jgi:hypothetical protein|nr:glycoside hydrolase [Thermoguttaceae bacterium]